MKILIFSDSHGNRQRMREWIERETPDHLIHLGDYYGDLPEALRVPGNCDPYKPARRVKVVSMGDVRFFVTHGHLHKVKSTLVDLIHAAKHAKARVVLFGHTHMPFMKEYEGMILLNPGSAVSSGLCVEIDTEIRVRFLGDVDGIAPQSFSLE